MPSESDPSCIGNRCRLSWWLLGLGRKGRLSFGWGLLLVGMVTAPTPVPLGLPMIAVSLALLSYDSQTVRRGVTVLRRKSPRLSRALRSVRHRLPHLLQEVVDSTDPFPVSNSPPADDGST